MNNFCQIKPVEKLVPKVLKNLLSTYLLSNILSATNWPQQQQISARIFSTACLVGIHKPEKQPKHFLGNFSLASYRFDEGTLGWHLVAYSRFFRKKYARIIFLEILGINYLLHNTRYFPVLCLLYLPNSRFSGGKKLNWIQKKMCLLWTSQGSCRPPSQGVACLHE